MNLKTVIFFIISLVVGCSLFGQSHQELDKEWEISGREGIILRFDKTTRLPRKDNIEMSGKKVASIIYYEVDTNRNLIINKDIIFPQLRVFNKSNEPDWKKYRAYFRKNIADDFTPSITYNNQILIPNQVDSIEINGMINFYYAPINGLKFIKRIYPSMNERLLVEEWQIVNIDKGNKAIEIGQLNHIQSEKGFKGTYTFMVDSPTKSKISLEPRQTHILPIRYGATLNNESFDSMDYKEAWNSRIDFLKICQENLILKSPDETLNMLFYFSKIRAAESIYASSMGLVHSPGGGNYYVGIWANDQVEYSGPFFPYLGYDEGKMAAYNTYNKFLNNIPENGQHIPYAFEVDGNFPMTHLDRGDAAMIAYGTSLFVLNSGDLKQAKKLWPLITWSLEYCHNQKNIHGAIKSESDEMEGRIETGDANLSTSSLYYGGLKFSSLIAKALGEDHVADSLYTQQLQMEKVIEDYFGWTIEGLETYRYFDGNNTLRHWICLPLTMGITQRKTGTLNALFHKLWTENGILVEYDPNRKKKKQTFWDRATLYALRGALKVGETSIAIDRLKEYSTKRLLGDHVPYPIEAYPENNMKHLSAESALYCRIFIEGLLGIEPLNFTDVQIRPNLPDDWDYLEIENLFLFDLPWTLSISKENKGLRVIVKNDLKVICDETIKPNNEIIIKTK